jgi:hypothetical protein
MPMANREDRIEEALAVLAELGMPRAQLNERSALCLLALLDLQAKKSWSKCAAPLMGITPIMEWGRLHYGKEYAPNTRETFRRQTMHQFVAAGIALYNPDKPDRPVNSPHAVYQIEPNLLAALKTKGTARYDAAMAEFKVRRRPLAERYAMEREMRMVPVEIAKGKKIKLSPGEHSELIKAIVEEFGPRFAPAATLVYIGDTGKKWGYFNADLLAELDVHIDNHGKMPDVVLHFTERNWLILVESVTSHGPVDAKRHEELARLFAGCKAGLVYVSAFPSRRVMNKYLETISWESEVWCADAPAHLIHFNGVRFLGPYGN